MVLSVIIVNYNVKYFIEQCLRSVEKATQQIDAEIIVVDNASTDGSVSYLQQRFPSVKFLRNNINVGFGKANNQGLVKSNGELVLFLNPDTIIPEDALEKCISFLTTRADAGALGVRMIDGSGKYLPESKRGFPSFTTSFFKLSGITSRFPRSRRLAKYYLGHLPEHEVNEVDVLAGAFLMVKKQVLDVTGAFDEAFFMYGEDIDLSYRVQKAGWKNFYFPVTSIVHFKGESTKKGDLDYVKMFYNAMSIFVTKHYGAGKSGLYPLFIQLAIALRAIPSALKTFLGSPQRATASALSDSLLICSPEEGKKIINTLEKTNRSRKFQVCTSPPPLEVLKHTQEIIFSETVISYKEMIGIMQQLKNRSVFRFYNPASSAIIGSDSKNKSGEVIV
jgi:GT2 family glycosyltransferase